MIKILIGGSPCTYWSVAQKKNREVEAKGLGWELFKNYLIAKEKFKPDFFLYENNKSAAQAIKDQISQELGVELMHINSALVSAQNRQRFYAFNWSVEQPEDRGILLRDILESTAIQTEKGYELAKVSDTPLCVNPMESGKSRTVDAHMGKLEGNLIPRINHPNPAKQQYDCIAEAVGVGYRNRREDDGKLYRRFETSGEPKANALTTVQTDSMVAEPIRIGTIENNAQTPEHDSQQYRVYSPEGKSVTLCGNGGGVGAKTGLYATPIEDVVVEPFNPTEGGKSHTLTASYGKISEQPGSQFGTEKNRQRVIQTWNGEEKPIYEVKDGEIELKGKKYPIKLPDGLYIIRKLTPVECERLQTLPDGYTAAVSNTQRYKGLGNGWTAEVIIHILNGALKDVPRDEEIVVLSMYDGIGTGRYCLEKMGFTNVTYYAYEIDEPAMKVALSNYPDIIEMGDAFALRDDSWELGKKIQPTEAATKDKEPADEATDLSDAPEEIKRKITENAEALKNKEEHEEPKPQEQRESSASAVHFDAAEQLRKLADERRALANIHPDTDRFTNDVLAIEYAVSVLEAMAI